MADVAQRFALTGLTGGTIAHLNNEDSPLRIGVGSGVGATAGGMAGSFSGSALGELLALLIARKHPTAAKRFANFMGRAGDVVGGAIGMNAGYELAKADKPLKMLKLAFLKMADDGFGIAKAFPTGPWMPDPSKRQYADRRTALKHVFNLHRAINTPYHALQADQVKLLSQFPSLHARALANHNFQKIAPRVGMSPAVSPLAMKTVLNAVRSRIKLAPRLGM